MSATQSLALKLRAAPAPGRPRGRTTVRAAGAAHAGALLQHRRGVSLAQGGRFLRGAPLPASQRRPRALPWAERAARRHGGGSVVAAAAAGVRSMSKLPQGDTGLYDPSMDRDSCGVGFIAELSAEPSRKTVSASATTRAPAWSSYFHSLFFLAEAFSNSVLCASPCTCQSSLNVACV